MYNYNKPVLSTYDPTKLEILSILRPEDDLISNCGPKIKKTVSFDDVVHFDDEKKIVTYVVFDCDVTFFTWTPTKNRQINRERNYHLRSCEKLQCIPSSDQHICSVDEQHSSSIFLNPYTLFDIVPAAFITLNHTNNTHSMSNRYPQPTTHQPRTDSYQVGVLFIANNGKWKEGIVPQLCILSMNLLIERTSLQNSFCGWSVEWSLEARSNEWNSAVCDELHLYLSVAICFSCLISLVCCCNRKICCFLKIYIFVSSLWRLWMRSKDSLITSM